ncbi:hypothetical protein GOODEAATRI_011612 [Goodea atripinnis]|uniref:Uncharacterized protein n=1 Tax=Goodea atripinnis TaxID=208336 RepID=A0ABV0NTT4_9TELE
MSVAVLGHAAQSRDIEVPFIGSTAVVLLRVSTVLAADAEDSLSASAAKYVSKEQNEVNAVDCEACLASDVFLAIASQHPSTIKSFFS